VQSGAIFGTDVQINDDDVSGARAVRAGWWTTDESSTREARPSPPSTPEDSMRNGKWSCAAWFKFTRVVNAAEGIGIGLTEASRRRHRRDKAARKLIRAQDEPRPAMPPVRVDAAARVGRVDRAGGLRRRVIIPGAARV
jgi:hypothetical protein